MRFLVKEPGAWTWTTITTDSLESEVAKGRLKGDWLIRLEDESVESTVDQLLTALRASGSTQQRAIPANEVIILAMNRQVAAVNKSDGRIVWSTELLGGVGSGFITLAIEGERIFAGCAGHLHCLDLGTGRILWTNELPGYGYALASLCLPGQTASPSPNVQEFNDEAHRRTSH
jgi:outer membrane protein assembly factor BamB